MHNKNEVRLYRAFEDRYRGSRELIMSRLQVYIPWILPLLDVYSERQVLDLGCGRGEWLELLKENGFQAVGVDLDRGMLEACVERGLTVSEKDALTALRELSDESQLIVSGFHIAEHLPFDVLSDLVCEAVRVLKPGGLLILETPNPENIKVATANFYLDPTHQRPIPQQLLVFLAEYFGFSRVKILRLQESKEIHEKSSVALLDVIDGVSPDYSMIAQKKASSEILNRFDRYFSQEYGITLESLTEKFEQRLAHIEIKTQEASSFTREAVDWVIKAQINAERIENKLIDAELRTERAETRAKEAILRTEKFEAQASEALLKIERAEKRTLEAESRASYFEVRSKELENRMKQMEADVQNAWHHYSMVINSHSWKTTYPLRLAGIAARWFVRGSIAWITFAPSSRPRRILRITLVALKRKIQSNYKLKAIALRFLTRFPRLKERLKRVGDDQRYYSGVGTVHQSNHSIENLNSSSRKIYKDLKASIEKNKE
ncbi:class I SAM-dependent methyltransferase [Ferroacidibacillus organovorans]|uniref:class I SAM-dependent methyltransferase n=1 Tax=Ferroacidibacillus organovorans TaxID=1765683 RepID=UPI000834BECF|nr:class I SAM-dependent methyltransferase [Ferroacidibacillus organovorans]